MNKNKKSLTLLQYEYDYYVIDVYESLKDNCNGRVSFIADIYSSNKNGDKISLLKTCLGLRNTTEVYIKAVNLLENEIIKNL